MARPGPPDLSARELQAVVTVAQCNSFVAAALTLNLSQPALTRIIQRVERALGVALFRRTTRRVEVTDEGREFAAVAGRILNDLQISTRRMQERSKEVRGQIIVSSVMSVAHTALAAIVKAYRAKRPQVEVHVREGVHGSVLEDVRGGAADLGITYVEGLPEQMRVVHLGREAFHVVLPAGHPLTKRRGIALADLGDSALVSLPGDSRTRRTIDVAAAAHGLVLNHVVTVTQFASQMSFVQAGVGVAIVPGGALPEARAAGLVARPLTRPRLVRDLGVITLREREPTAAAGEFIELLRERIKPTIRTT
jgi:DNA-binding transcriptional LysR family regulator